MTVLSRLLHVLKAQMADNLAETRFGRWSAGTRARWQRAWEESAQEDWDPRAEHGEGTGAGARGNPDQDPKLAGYYANLELPYGADLEAVQAARKRLLRKYHPDLHSADAEKQRLATELVQGLNRAYEELVKHLERQR